MNPTLSDKFEFFASRISEYPDLHAKFINTISFLEYMGARKILKSQDEKTFTAQILAHTAEEIRHAQLLKRIALKMSSGLLQTYSEDHLFCGAEARRYFQTIDDQSSTLLENSVGGSTPCNSLVRYLLTTLLIEERANQVYPFYETILSKAGFPGILKAIVKEEEAHLEDMKSLLQNQFEEGQFELLRAQLEKLENKAFSTFLACLSNHLPIHRGEGNPALQGGV